MNHLLSAFKKNDPTREPLALKKSILSVLLKSDNPIDWKLAHQLETDSLLWESKSFQNKLSNWLSRHLPRRPDPVSVSVYSILFNLPKDEVKEAFTIDE